MAAAADTTQAKVVVITGASSGFGELAADALARAGHTVYSGIRDIEGHNASRGADIEKPAQKESLELHPFEMDVSSEASVDAAIEEVMDAQGRLDVVVHNAGHMVLGPTESFTAEQLAEIYDVNTIGTQRVNRAALPHLREQGSGLVVWVGSSSTRGGTPPYLAPYFAAKAGMDALAVSYAAELIRFGIETTIIVPGAFTAGTQHFAHAGEPADRDRASQYEGRYGGLMDQVNARLAELAPADADVGQVAEQIVRVVNTPVGKRPFRVHVDPNKDGSEVVSVVADRIRVEFLRRLELDDLVTPGASL